MDPFCNLVAGDEPEGERAAVLWTGFLDDFAVVEVSIWPIKMSIGLRLKC